MDLEESQLDSTAGGLEEAVREAVGGERAEGEDAVDLKTVARQFAEYLVVDSKQDVSTPRTLTLPNLNQQYILVLFFFHVETTVGRPYRERRVSCGGVQESAGARPAQHGLQRGEGRRSPQLRTATQRPVCPRGSSRGKKYIFFNVWLTLLLLYIFQRHLCVW